MPSFNHVAINLSFQSGFLFNENAVLHIVRSVGSTKRNDRAVEMAFLRPVARHSSMGLFAGDTFVTTGHRANLHSADTVDLYSRDVQFISRQGLSMTKRIQQ
jgi:hypothetical protein